MAQNNDINCKSPILLMVFNRPEETRRVFELIRSVKPPRLYVAADGARTDRDGEAAKVAEARRIATNVDWDCEVKTLFRDKNLGCGKAVSEGITWFFEHEEEGIILEDDVLPHPTWFPFVDELLERYRDNEKIMCITAYGVDTGNPNDPSYAFSIYNIIWGWASWRRAWNKYDFHMQKWPELRNTDWLKKVNSHNRLFAINWKAWFDDIHAGNCDTWDFQWTYSIWQANGLCIHPCINTIENIGFGAEATHTKSEPNNRLVSKPIVYPLVHPTSISIDRGRDTYSLRNFYGCTVIYLIKSFLKKSNLLHSTVRKIKSYLISKR